MANKKTRKEINAVIDKYLGRDERSLPKQLCVSSALPIACGIGIDLLFTGGLFSVGTFMLGGLGALLGAGSATSLLVDNIKKSQTNTAAQTIKCNGLVNSALRKMESRLQIAFNEVAAQATQENKNNFMNLAAEIGQDVKTLSPAFKIVAGGTNGFGTDEYEFIVDKKRLVTLAQSFQELQKLPAPQMTPQEEIQELKKRLNALENPRIVRLDKDPPPAP